jgi:hypothetical protein
MRINRCLPKKFTLRFLIPRFRYASGWLPLVAARQLFRRIKAWVHARGRGFKVHGILAGGA